MTLNIILSLTLAQAFSRSGLPPHGGLALANTLATALETTILLILLGRRLRGMDMVRLRRGLLASILASGLMAGSIQLWLNWTMNQTTWFRGAGGVLIGLGAYWVAAWLFGAPEASQLPGFLLGRWIKRERSGP
jgi:putative peptidoglycan lipid II flippase